MYIYIYIYIHWRLGVMRAVFSPAPNREIDFDFDCVCVACVRACMRAKLRERDASSVARVRQTNLWG